MISGIPETRDPSVLYYWFVNELKRQGCNDDFISKVLDKPPYVPRETCSNCGQALPPLKVKHKEVFEGVCWLAWPRIKGEDYVMYPNIDVDKKHKYIGKPPMKMILEWEE